LGVLVSFFLSELLTGVIFPFAVWFLFAYLRLSIFAYLTPKETNTLLFSLALLPFFPATNMLACSFPTLLTRKGQPFPPLIL